MINIAMSKYILIGGAVLALAANEGWLTHIEAGHRLRSAGHYREALRGYQETLQRAERLGSDQKAIGTARNGIGVVLLPLHEFRRAEMQLRQSFAAFEAAEPGKPESARVLLNLVTALCHQHCLEEADEANRRATAILENSFGPHHPDVAASLVNRGELYLQMSRCSEAASACNGGRRLLGSWLTAEHPVLLASVHNLGTAQLCLDNFGEAHELIGTALQLRQVVLPSGHPDIAIPVHPPSRLTGLGFELRTKLPCRGKGDQT